MAIEKHDKSVSVYVCTCKMGVGRKVKRFEKLECKRGRGVDDGKMVIYYSKFNDQAMRYI